jgi:hypothetical protein
MRKEVDPFRVCEFRLAKGQSHFEQLPRGTVIRVAAGSVVLVQRTTLGHGTLSQQTTMPRGTVHCVDETTWVELIAQSDAALWVMVATPQPTPWVQALHAVQGFVLAGRKRRGALG